MNYAPQCAGLADAKREHPWLKAAPSHALQQTLKDLDRACRDHGTFKVRWRSKARWSPPFRFPDAQQISVDDDAPARPGEPHFVTEEPYASGTGTRFLVQPHLGRT